MRTIFVINAVDQLVPHQIKTVCFLILLAMVSPLAGVPLQTLYDLAQTDPQAALAEVRQSTAAENDQAWHQLIAAKALHYQGDFAESLDLLRSLQDEMDASDDPWLFVATHRFVAQNHYRLGAMDLALRAGLTAESAATEHKVLIELGHVKNMLAAVHLQTGNTEKALALFESALETFRDQQSIGNVAKLENNLAVLYIEAGDPQAAEPHLQASLELARKLNRTSTLVSNLVNLVELRAQQGRFDEAALALEECFAVTSAASVGARVYCHEAATELYGRNGAVASAIDNTRNALALAQRLGLRQVTLDNTVALADLLAANGDHAEAYDYAKQAQQQTLDLKDETLQVRMDELAALHEIEQERLAMANLQQRSRLQARTQMVLLIAMAVLIPLLLIALWLLWTRGRLMVDLQRERDRANRLAQTDPLTGIANRREFHRQLSRLVDGASYSLIMMDIDHFKQLNDSKGHEAGDNALIAVGQAIEQAMPADAVVGRWGGEEFVALVTGPVGTARQVVSEIQQALSASLPSLTLSFGIAERQDGEPVAVVLDHADQAMYASKQAGRNRVTTWGDIKQTD